MPSIDENSTLRQFQDFVEEVYSLPNDRHYSMGDMLSNYSRFNMRALKGIRKNDLEKAKANLLITLSWFCSIMNRLHIDLANEVWSNFPYKCTYCNSCPCICKEEKSDTRQSVQADSNKRPSTIREFQEMFQQIYPAEKRTLEHAAVHLAEELGEFSEAILVFRGSHGDDHFRGIAMEAADIFSCAMGVFNSLGVDVQKELSRIFSENCHVCKKAPCECTFDYVMNFRS